MKETWKQTSCPLCFVNCGLKVQVEGNQIVKVLPDKANPRSQGHICAKGRNINAHQRHAGRLSAPLKRLGEDFEPISWQQAFSEIAERLQAIVGEHGPRSYAYMGGGGQGNHFEAAFGVAFMRALGSRYHFSALAQEHSGRHWVQGRIVGRQPMNFIAHAEAADMLLGTFIANLAPRVVLQRFADTHRSRRQRDSIEIDHRPAGNANLHSVGAAVMERHVEPPALDGGDGEVVAAHGSRNSEPASTG